jgi:uncharacterized repeat protein (TIGR02543 family)
MEFDNYSPEYYEMMEEQGFGTISTYSFESDVTLYPLWAQSQRIVNFHLNGGLWINDQGIINTDLVTMTVPKESYYVYKYLTVALPSAYISHPTKALLGWSASENAEIPDIPYESIFSMNYYNDVEIPADLYAVWGDDAVITINPNGGEYGCCPEYSAINLALAEDGRVYSDIYTESMNTPITVGATTGSRFRKTLNLKSSSGKTFEGWSTDPNGEVEYTSLVNLIPDGDMTLYAIWS